VLITTTWNVGRNLCRVHGIHVEHTERQDEASVERGKWGKSRRQLFRLPRKIVGTAAARSTWTELGGEMSLWVVAWLTVTHASAAKPIVHHHPTNLKKWCYYYHMAGTKLGGHARGRQRRPRKERGPSDASLGWWNKGWGRGCRWYPWSGACAHKRPNECV